MRCQDHIVLVGFLIRKKQTFDKRALFEMNLLSHFFHIEDGIVFVNFKKWYL